MKITLRFLLTLAAGTLFFCASGISIDSDNTAQFNGIGGPGCCACPVGYNPNIVTDVTVPPGGIVGSPGAVIGGGGEGGRYGDQRGRGGEGRDDHDRHHGGHHHHQGHRQ
jgi:hypothetical protein